MLLQALKKIDQFGIPIQLTFKSQYKHKTLTGALITTLMITICIVATYFFGREVLIRQNPITTNDKQYSEEPQYFPISSKTFPFAFGIQDGTTWTHYIDESIYTISAVNILRTKILNQQTGQYDIKKEMLPVAFGPCDIHNDLSQILEAKQYFTKLDHNQLYCLKDDKNSVPSIKGNFDSEHFLSIVLSFSSCKNQTESTNKKIICKPQEEIDKKLNAGFFAIYYADSTVYQRNFENPIRYQGKDYYTFVTNQMRKNIDFFLKHIILNSDEGWLFEDNNQRTGISFCEWREMLDTRHSNIFLQFTIRLDSQLEVFTRQYKKIQNVMAEVGGFLKFIFLIAVIVIMPLTKLNFYTQLLNEIFLFQNNQNQGQQIVINNQKQIIKQGQSTQFDLEKNCDDKDQTQLELSSFQKKAKRKSSVLAGVLTRFLDNKKVSQIDNKIIDDIKSPSYDNENNNNNNRDINQVFRIQTGGFKMSNTQFIFYYLCPCRKERKKQKYIFQTIHKVKQRLDAVFLLNKINELDKLKMLLLTPNQIRLFNLFSKPIINVEDLGNNQQDENNNKTINNLSYQYNSLINQEKCQIQAVSEAFQAFSSIDETKQMSEFDKKLIELLDPKIREIFQKAKSNIVQIQSKKSINILINQPQFSQKLQEIKDIDNDDDDDKKSKENDNQENASSKGQKYFIPIEIDQQQSPNSVYQEKSPKLFSNEMLNIYIEKKIDKIGSYNEQDQVKK